MPSRTANTATTSAATGSAHHQPKAALSVSPSSRTAARIPQNSDSCASAASAAAGMIEKAR